MRYTAYNLSIQSDMALPELLPEQVEPASPPDVQIRLAPITPSGLPGGQQLGPFLWAHRNSLWLQVPRVARFLVQDGHTILIDPEQGIDEDSIRVFLLGSALGALLFQRGHLVLHGNAIRVGDQCMVCVGHSGAGKSTLAAGFMQRGYEVLADDVVPVDKACHVLPGFPRIKLWQDVADKLHIETGHLKRIRPGIEKFNYPLGNGFCRKPLPIRWIYTITGEINNNICITPIRGMHRFTLMHQNTYRKEFMEYTSEKIEYMQHYSRISNQINIAKINRSNAINDIDKIIALLIKDMEISVPRQPS